MARVTVEDCLTQVPNRFALALLAVKRARQLQQGTPPLIPNSNKPCVSALREVAGGRVRADLDIDSLLMGIVPEEKKKRRRRR